MAASFDGCKRHSLPVNHGQADVFRKEGKRHRLSVAVLAYLVILAAGFNAFNILLGHYVQVNLGDLLLNSVICMAVWLARGNGEGRHYGIAMTKDDIFNTILGKEGGYVDHPNDKGGPTNWGITQATARAHGYTGDMRNLTREQALAILSLITGMAPRFDQWQKYPLPLPPNFAIPV